MKKQTLLCLSFLLFFSSLIFSQNEFGAVGSYWQYDYVPHNGDGYGWTKIEIVKDSLIDGETHKIIRETFYHKPIASSAYQTSSILFSTMQIKNDSVFFGGNLILDFGMTLTDSMYLNLGAPSDLQLAIDSITTEEINGFQYKKWYGQKLCLVDPDNPDPYEPFVILEGVGQVHLEFLFWNFDNCIIGGGHNYFSCYKNGDFTYPPNNECVPLMLSATEELEIKNSVKIFPNPFNDFLKIASEESKILEITILNVEGKEIYRKSLNEYSAEIQLNLLSKGIYFIKIKTEENIIVDKILKN